MEVEELSELLFVHLREISTDLEKALPQEADKLKGEHEKFCAQKIPKLEELRRSCNLEPAYKTG